MELIIQEKTSTICLNMIVKNESHIIENTLEKLCKKIHFDYWVICDTGSTDNTPQIITNFFEKMGIKGELYHDEWINFAHNRTLALQRAYKKTDLLLVFDADDEIVGDVIMPTQVLYDDYYMKFGSAVGTSYTRVLLINNHKKYKYLSVIHEFITCIDGPTSSTTVEGDYYVVSGRTSSRNLDPDKYLKDALILEKAHAEALKNNDNLFHRYSYYCANSYKDCGRFDDAIKWYKITLSQENQWDQENYTSCLAIYDCYKALNQEATGFYYLVKAFAYDKERVECLYPLLVHYCCEKMYQIAYNYYMNVKDFFEKKYLNADMSKKLFINPDRYSFFLPYYMILIADKVQDFKCVVRMYEIIFIKKSPIFDEWYIGNLLYNLQFFLKHVPKDNLQFIPLANNYINFLFVNGVKSQSFDCLTKDEYKRVGINVDKYIIKEVTLKPQEFSKTECASSKNILIYTGFSDVEWNYSYMLNNALGGSEKAVAYISKCFPKDYNVFISGQVKNETIDNIQYIHQNQLTNLIDSTPFHTVIVSRYIGFYEMYQTCSFYQSFIWAHDTLLLPYGSTLNEKQILKKWNNYINGCVCLTEWHKTLFSDKYPELKSKISLINNGIDLDSFYILDTNKKTKNKFIYTSRPDRGLNVLLKLWSQIIEKIPDAILTISNYGTFPSNPEEVAMKTVIDATPSIHYLGKLNVEQLYLEMSTAEFWLYPTNWPETSCITALEMLMSKVICLYYPIAGLVDTVGNYGIQIKPGSEIETIVSLTIEQNQILRQKGREYAETCSWENRFTKWLSVLRLNKQKWYFYCSPSFETKMVQQYIDNLNNIYPDYCIYLTKNKNTILTEIPSKITFVYEVFDTSIFEKLQNRDFSLLNTEPLNIRYRLQNIKNIQKLYNSLAYYDYSESNLHILTENGIDFKYKTYLPYICSSSELLQLQQINKNTEKVFDFGIIKTLGGEISPRRQKIVNFLKSNHFSINIIEGWDHDRDNELAKCKLILNIHGNLDDDVSMIFEHIRCNRLLESGFNILSENCYNLSIDFIEKYPNLKLIGYDEFFNIGKIIDCYNNILSNKEHNQYVLNVLNNAHLNMHWFPQSHIKFLDKLFLEFNPDNMIIYDIGSSVLHWSQNAKNIWKNSKIYLFDGMTEMKLFYDEYNNKNNTTYEYNVGVLCDEDYKRISFYQSDEFSGGNSYYKEIGHRDSDKIFTDKNIKQKIGIKLETIVKIKNIPAPDLIKIDVQGAELDILKGSMELINNAKFLIVELQHIEYNKGAPLCNQTRDFLIENGWEVYAEKFSNNGPDADWCFINKNYKSLNLNFIQTQLKIIDCFIFYNELDLLTYRLNILNDVVDYFVLVESTHTFVGKEKPLFYQENKHLFEKFNNKIIHVIVDDFPHKHPNIDFKNGEQWNNEKFQRNCISRGIHKLNLNSKDIITILDLDEIPNPNILTQIKTNDIAVSINILQMDFYYYNLNSKMDHKWNHSKILTFEKYNLLNIDCENIRFYTCPIINNGGWHLSYFGDNNFIKNKIENFSHQELNLELFTNQEKIQNRIKNKQDLFDRDIKICHINIEDNDNLPPEYDIYLKNYYTNGTNNMNNYKYTQTWFLVSEISNSLDKFLDKSKENKILEIGCFEGLSSVFFADNFLDNPKSSLTCVDPFLTINNNDHSQFLQNNEEMNFDFNISICENSDRITKHKITSDIFFENNNQTYNFIYIDGCHEPDFIKRDMENSFNILEKNGIMWMDDYGGGDGIQIKNVMNTFLEKYNGQYDLIHMGYQLAIKKC